MSNVSVMSAAKSCGIARFHRLAMETSRSWRRLACRHKSNPYRKQILQTSQHLLCSRMISTVVLAHL